MKPVNYIAIVVSAVAKFALGAVWYTALFGAKWMELTGVSQEKMQGSVGMSYGGALVSYLVQAYVLAHFVGYTNANDAKGGAQTGFWLWLGFSAPLLAGSVFFEARSWTLFCINAGYELLALVVMGIILASWKKKAA